MSSRGRIVEKFSSWRIDDLKGSWGVDSRIYDDLFTRF